MRKQFHLIPGKESHIDTLILHETSSKHKTSKAFSQKFIDDTQLDVPNIVRTESARVPKVSISSAPLVEIRRSRYVIHFESFLAKPFSSDSEVFLLDEDANVDNTSIFLDAPDDLSDLVFVK